VIKLSVKKLKALLGEFTENEAKIEEAKVLYERRTELTAQIVDLAMKVKGIESSGGLLKERIPLSFKDGTNYEIKPLYINAAGEDKGAVSRVCTLPLFEILKKK
jgi:hypothetical protein